MHADFLRVQKDHPIVVQVPVHFLNEEACVGVRLGGGQVFHNLTQIEIACLPGDLPEYIEIDIKDLAAGESIHLSQVTLPAGATIPSLALGEDHDHVVVSVHTKSGGASSGDAGEGDAETGSSAD